MRILFLIVAIVAVFMIVRTLLRRPPARSGAQEALKQEGPVVRCEHCGVHVPAAEVIRRDNVSFCSEDHANAFARLRDER